LILVFLLICQEGPSTVREGDKTLIIDCEDRFLHLQRNVWILWWLWHHCDTHETLTENTTHSPSQLLHLRKPTIFTILTIFTIFQFINAHFKIHICWWILVTTLKIWRQWWQRRRKIWYWATCDCLGKQCHNIRWLFLELGHSSWLWQRLTCLNFVGIMQAANKQGIHRVSLEQLQKQQRY